MRRDRGSGRNGSGRCPYCRPEQGGGATTLFDGMRARDTTAMRASFVPNASMQSLTPTDVRFEAIDGWIKSVSGARGALRRLLASEFP